VHLPKRENPGNLLSMRIAYLALMLIGCGDGYYGPPPQAAPPAPSYSYTPPPAPMTCSHIGSSTFCNGGGRSVTCTRIGNQTFCN
jgi:hypothetical protein